ncbi:MAG: hypothetical protein JNL08_02995 [Planctomycetes bacterium]|nr:hypothetical protein [Planctomycetota bacterium]
MIHDWLREQQNGAATTRSTWSRLRALVDFEFRALFRSRWGVAVFCLCLFPGLGRLVMLAIMFGVVNFGPVGLRNRLQGRPELPTLDPWRVDFYLEPVLSVVPGMVFALLLTSLVVARTIARDRIANSLELYWTRGISPAGYAFAKWLGGFLVIALVTVAVPAVLWLTAAFLADDWSLLLSGAFDMARAVFGLAVVTAVWTAICLGLSIVCGTPNAAMVAWSMLLFGSTAVGAVFANALHQPWLRSCFSIWEAGAVCARAIAGASQRDVSVAGAAATLATTLGVLFLLARPRLRITEALR